MSTLINKGYSQISNIRHDPERDRGNMFVAKRRSQTSLNKGICKVNDLRNNHRSHTWSVRDRTEVDQSSRMLAQFEKPSERMSEVTVLLSDTTWNVVFVVLDENAACTKGPPGRLELLGSPYYLNI